MERRWLGVAEVAELLGVHPVTIRKMIGRREIPFTKKRGVGVRVDWVGYQKELERDLIRTGDPHGRLRG